MDVYITEDYVRSRYMSNMSMQKRDGRVCLQNDIKEAVDEKKLLSPDDNNKLPAASSTSALKIRMSATCTSNSFIEDILLNCFAP